MCTANRQVIYWICYSFLKRTHEQYKIKFDYTQKFVFKYINPFFNSFILLFCLIVILSRDLAYVKVVFRL